ncbi:TetR/AcrR family transcriptional regulator [Paenibacillus sp. Marseille-P2973]|uniref:TetR/AcrR family transcriptional regulator n=1 Tax=Paenibacillus sp. Marseille-P2973 TaxID=1871032 RepID=UPI001B37E931|nr:TetR-like C-terminal domain-containing protein [Paenibacillus sp. Marseille-P2973]MBQ4901417.1 TetR/AcrR family transcriptional regulator [Paenibacillus sp. Marseille-P2973]
MPEQKRIDPRAIRSRKMLKNAVFSLLTEHMEISQLTVQKIANRAELNRATFYLHYEDINDLLRQIVHEIFDDLSMKVEPLLQVTSNDEQQQLVTFLNYFYEYRSIFAVLVEHPGFKTHLTNLLKSTIEKRRGERNISSTGRVASVDIVAASLLGIIIWWIKEDTEYSAEYIADQITLMYKRRYL